MYRNTISFMLILFVTVSSPTFAQDSKSDSGVGLDQPITALKSAARDSRCHQAVYLALSDPDIRQLFIDKYQADHAVLKDICCLQVVRPPEYEFVHFNFECAPHHVCLVDPGFLVSVDIENNAVELMKESFTGGDSECRSIMRMPLPNTDMRATASGMAPQSGIGMVLGHSSRNSLPFIPYHHAQNSNGSAFVTGNGLGCGATQADAASTIRAMEWAGISQAIATTYKSVSRVTGMTGSLHSGNVRFQAAGEVPTSGWSEPQLLPIYYVVPPEDGIYEYQFVARPPTGFPNQVITPIQSPKMEVSRMRPMKGIRVTSANNSATMRLLQYRSTVPKPIDDIVMRAAEMNDGLLQIDVQYSGGCERHDFELFWDGSYMESNPPQVAFRLVHNANGDACESIIRESVLFALPELDPCIIRVSDGNGNELEVRYGLNE